MRERESERQTDRQRERERERERKEGRDGNEKKKSEETIQDKTRIKLKNTESDLYRRIREITHTILRRVCIVYQNL